MSANRPTNLSGKVAAITGAASDAGFACVETFAGGSLSMAKLNQAPRVALPKTGIKAFDLSGRVALVTSAGSGIGRAIAIGLAEAGADVACFGHNSSGGLDTTVEAVRKLGRRALVLEGSVQEPEVLASAIVQIERELGPLEVAINNAGINNNAPSEEMSLPQWQKLYDVNVTSVFLSCQAEAKVMLKRGRGSIINIASMSGSIVNRGLNQAHYNSSKAAVIHMSKSFAMEWAGRGVRVNVISPGYTLTPMNKRPEVAGVLKELAESTPMKRIAEPEEMAGPAVFLASDAASFITGHDLLVDGGFVCW